MPDSPNPSLANTLYNPEKSIQRFLEVSGYSREQYNEMLKNWHKELDDARTKQA